MQAGGGASVLSSAAKTISMFQMNKPLSAQLTAKKV